ncbi:MAG: iron ABC transporter permease [Candidatus Eremiobacteraeota bacterium]|nr:iron ABC transporter permease [Candidatus Eremiobacteraeota bacterium]
MHSRATRTTVWFITLLFGTIAAAALGLVVGGSTIANADLLHALAHPNETSDAGTIVWQLRAPRVGIGACVGAALAVSGALLQGLLRNPLVDPFLTGVSAGAGAAIAIGVAFGITAAFVPAVGFAAGMGTAVLVALLARRGRGIDAERLILAGVSLSALFSALVTLVLVRSGPANAATVLAWLGGSLANRGWSELASTAPYLVAGLALAALCAPSLNALRLGPSVARAVGVDLARTQWLVLSAAALLAAAAVALAGVVGFVGLIMPHVARRLVGNDARVSIVASALLGAAIVPLADALARSIAPPVEIPLGVLLAVAGVPAFLYLYLRPASATNAWGA